MWSWDRTPWLLEYLNIFSFAGFCPLWVLSFGAFVHFSLSLPTHVIVWRECWLCTTASCDHGTVHLDCWSIKIFSLFGGFCPLWVLSFYFICPMALLSIFAFRYPPTWSDDENVDCPPLYHVIMGSYTLIVVVLEYFLFLGVLSALSFILFRAFALWRFWSIFAFLCPPTDRMTRMVCFLFFFLNLFTQ